MALIEVENLIKNFGGSKAVEDVSFKVGKGEIFAILGPSGCGKTTTLRLRAFYTSGKEESWISISGLRPVSPS
jgi:ABC-type Fe3+/spermidine/putrescine transport system ATPase subunit